ncbi:hypothetical protein CBR_g18691 [Chara braunii]|uniref:Uncharacterized protein n=1 Tax=Chara braunii TaxID=69332 RepID=A0A388KW40_CHABU|nr:hypothetical protein CBR_g18691 [Chara braunii]|eukprot:GBG74280.1 hypothetical protein CBR_g18691 [Chara braunii]
MGVLLLEIKAELENLTNLIPEPSPQQSWQFKIKCTSCNEESDKESGVTMCELYDIPNSRGKAHLVQKCKFCGRTGTLTAVEGRGKPYTAEDSEEGKFVPVACFECRGLEPIVFYPRDGWVARGTESGTAFNDIDLSSGEFCDWDEKASASVGIYSIEHKFTVTK